MRSKTRLERTTKFSKLRDPSKETGKRFIVEWYGHTGKGDSLEPKNDICTHLKICG